MLYYNKTNKPFIISTSTIALQEQLQKDTKYIYKVYLQNNKIYDTINK